METVHAQFDNTILIQELQRDPIEHQPQLRPQTFEEYPGQEAICANLKVYTQAARMRGRMLDHCLFYGPPGLGKTTLAGIVAANMDCHMKVTSGPLIERTADLMGILANLEPRTVLFIDEIHRLPANVEEVLYSAMEDMRLDVLVGQGPAARSVKFELPPFCLIGATTRAGAISAPLRDRFGIQEHLDYYSPQDLCTIIVRSASILNTPICPHAALALAKRCRGTPRVANQLLRRVMDFALVAGKSAIDEDIIHSALARLGIDAEGLSKMDREFLTIILDRYDGGPVGLEAVAAALNEDKNTLEDVCEPYLVYRGYVLRTSRGRIISESGKKHLNEHQLLSRFP